VYFWLFFAQSGDLIGSFIRILKRDNFFSLILSFTYDVNHQEKKYGNILYMSFGIHYTVVEVKFIEGFGGAENRKKIKKGFCFHGFNTKGLVNQPLNSYSYYSQIMSRLPGEIVIMHVERSISAV